MMGYKNDVFNLVTLTLAIKLVREVINANPCTPACTNFQICMSIRLAVRVLTDRHTDRHTNGTDSITSTADAGGNEGFPEMIKEGADGGSPIPLNT